jgi:hypothetical protein
LMAFETATSSSAARMQYANLFLFSMTSILYLQKI